MQRRLLPIAIVAAVVLALAWVYVTRRPDTAAGGRLRQVRRRRCVARRRAAGRR